MRVVDQDVPSELFSDYGKSLRPAFQKWKLKFNAFKFNERRFGTGPNIFYARKRSAWRMPHMQGLTAGCPSGAQVLVRRAFRKCVTAFGVAHRNVSWVDAYGMGAYSRAQWFGFAMGSGEWYYNYFVSLTWWYLFNLDPPPWCMFHDFLDTYVAWGDMGDPDTNYNKSTTLKCGYWYSGPDVVSGEARTYIRLDQNKYPKLLSEIALRAFVGSSFVDVYAIDPAKLNIETVTWNTMPPRVEHLGRLYLWHPALHQKIPLGHFTYNPVTWERVDTLLPLLDKTISSCIELVGVKLKPEPTPGVAAHLEFYSREHKSANHAYVAP